MTQLVVTVGLIIIVYLNTIATNFIINIQGFQHFSEKKVGQPKKSRT